MIATAPSVQTFLASTAALSDVRKFVQAEAEAASLPGHIVDDLLVAVTEACAEMLAHEKSAVMLVSWWARDGVVEILVKDLGVTEAVVPIPEDDVEGYEDLFTGRLGFPHILEFVDEWEVLPGGDDDPGTVVRVVKATSGEQELALEH